MIRIFKYDKILERTAMPSDVGATVSEIIENVKKNGDKALYEYAKKFDKADLKTLEVTKEEIDEAVASVEPEFLKTLEKAAENIKEFHSKQVRNGYSFKRAGGAVGVRGLAAPEKRLYRTAGAGGCTGRPRPEADGRRKTGHA